MSRRSTTAALVVLLVTLLAVLPSSAEDDRDDGSTTDRSSRKAPGLRIVDQNHDVEPGRMFVASLEVLNAPAGSELAVDFYEAITDEAGLEAALGGEPTNIRATYDVLPLADDETALQPALFGIHLTDRDHPAPADGSWSSRVDEPGTYPIRVRLRGPDGSELSHLITFVRRPPKADRALLDAGVVVDLDAPTTRGTPDESISRILDLVDEHPDVPFAVHVSPDRIRSLRSDPEIAERLDAIDGGDGMNVLRSFFVPIDPQQLADEGFVDDIADQAELGTATLDAEFESSASSTWLLRTPITDETAGLLREAGMNRAIVTDDVVDRSPFGAPFRLGASEDVPVGVTTDLLSLPTGRPFDPDLTVTHVLTDAIVRGELSGRPGATVLLVDPRHDPELIDLLLDRIAEIDGPVRMRSVDDLFGSGPFEAAALKPTRERSSPDYATERRRAERLQQSYRSMLPEDTPVDEEFHVAMARTVSSDLTEDERIAAVGEIHDHLQQSVSTISMSEGERFTLGANDAHVPVSFTSSADEPLRVRIHLDAPERLEFPHDVIEATIAPGQRTIVEIPVRSLTSGDTPMTLTVTSPDGWITLTSGRYTIRSTAVSGVGLLLTIGAAAFLVIWWGRHVVRTRRRSRAG